MSSSVPTVFVVDDDRSFLTAVARLLRAAGHAVETFSSAPGLLERLARPAAGCILADLRMPGMDGLALHEAVADSSNPLPVIFLSGHGDVPTTVHALKHGAEDFLTKTAPRKDLLEAVARGIARDAAERAARATRAASRERYEALTPRERQVLAHVVQGQVNKEIAWDLAIHERTVKLHRTSITTKLGVSSVAELTRWVQEAGLLPELDAEAGRPLPKGQ
jgi:FixJ family two-component response regulator